MPLPRTLCRFPLQAAAMRSLPRSGLVQSVLCGAPHNADFGAAWKKTARETQREYLSVKLDDPSFPAPIYANLFKGETDYTLVWSR